MILIIINVFNNVVISVLDDAVHSEITEHEYNSFTSAIFEREVDERNEHADEERVEDRVQVINMRRNKNKGIFKGIPRKSREDRKKKQITGEEYVTNKGNIISVRKCTPLQACRLNCCNRFDDEICMKTFNEYWNCGSYNKRIKYISEIIIGKKSTFTKKKLDLPEKKKK